jgi:hypothetical protein
MTALMKENKEATKKLKAVFLPSFFELHSSGLPSLLMDQKLRVKTKNNLL